MLAYFIYRHYLTCWLDIHTYAICSMRVVQWRGAEVRVFGTHSLISTQACVYISVFCIVHVYVIDTFSNRLIFHGNSNKYEYETLAKQVWMWKQEGILVIFKVEARHLYFIYGLSANPIWNSKCYFSFFNHIWYLKMVTKNLQKITSL